MNILKLSGRNCWWSCKQ